MSAKKYGEIVEVRIHQDNKTRKTPGTRSNPHNRATRAVDEVIVQNDDVSLILEDESRLILKESGLDAVEIINAAGERQIVMPQ